MRNERLTKNFYGVEILNGVIDLKKDHTYICFFIVEHTTNEDYIKKQALQLLTEGCKMFNFWGKAEKLWHCCFDEIDIMMNPSCTSEDVALTVSYDTVEDFLEELYVCIKCRYFVLTDIFLFYDDKDLYEDALRYLHLK